MAVAHGQKGQRGAARMRVGAELAAVDTLTDELLPHLLIGIGQRRQFRGDWGRQVAVAKGEAVDQFSPVVDHVTDDGRRQPLGDRS